MTTHLKGTRAQWLEARMALLKDEKELTRRNDELAARRRELPWVPVEETYNFDTEAGPATLRDLFEGRSQLFVYHFMYGPDFKAGCPSCSSIADGFNGPHIHLRNRDVAFWAVSRAPLDKLLAFRRRMGWSFPWASSQGSKFNWDFNVSFTEEQQQREGGVDYNYRKEPKFAWSAEKDGTGPGTEFDFAAKTGSDVATFQRDRPGLSAFVLEDGVIYHTYSAYARGVEAIWGAYHLLDRTPKGRNEKNVSWTHHDQYPTA